MRSNEESAAPLSSECASKLEQDRIAPFGFGAGIQVLANHMVDAAFAAMGVKLPLIGCSSRHSPFLNGSPPLR